MKRIPANPVQSLPQRVYFKVKVTVTVYTIHLRLSEDAIPSALDRMVLVPDKFNFCAFLFGPIWMVSARLWIGLVYWLFAVAGFGAFVHFFGLGGWATFLIYLLGSALLALEANALLRWRLARQGFECVDVTSADCVEEAERRFLARQELAEPRPRHESATTVGTSGVAHSPVVVESRIGDLFRAGDTA